MAKRDPWVRVKSEDELRAGMTVEIRPCLFCMRVERLMLLAEEAPGWIRDVDGNRWLGRRFRSTGGCRPPGFRNIGTPGFRRAVVDGRLYRLADDQLTDLSETRELENVR